MLFIFKIRVALVIMSFHTNRAVTNTKSAELGGREASRLFSLVLRVGPYCFYSGSHNLHIQSPSGTSPLCSLSGYE